MSTLDIEKMREHLKAAQCVIAQTLTDLEAKLGPGVTVRVEIDKMDVSTHAFKRTLYTVDLSAEVRPL